MIETNNLTKFPIDEDAVEKKAAAVLRGEKRRGNLSIVFADPFQIKEINKKYRNKDVPTDVLSFGFSEVSGNYSEELGEIMICPAQVEENAKKYGLKYQDELKRVLIHGILHILGYDHEKSEEEAKLMREKETFYFKK